MKKITQQNVLDFWFGTDICIDSPTEARTELWFALDINVSLDDYHWMEQCFGAAMDGKLDSWGKTPRGCLALILALTQFPRLIYQGTAMVFAGDSRALDLCVEGVNQGSGRELSLIERAFYYMPLQLAEDMDLQRESITIYQDLKDMTLPEASHLYTAFFELAEINFDTISRFGRFPQRNLINDRESTKEENDFLEAFV